MFLIGVACVFNNNFVVKGLSYKLDFSSCVIVPGFGKSSHILAKLYHRKFKY